MTADQNGDGADRASLQQEENAMSKLGQVVESVENYNKFVLDQVKRALDNSTYFSNIQVDHAAAGGKSGKVDFRLSATVN